MKVCLTLICLLFLRLQDGNAVRRKTGAEGGNITVKCPFLISGERKFVCRDVCEGENILIETTSNTAERGRYRVKYKQNSGLSHDFLYFTIKDLRKSDSGRYRCGLDRTYSGTKYENFELVVNEASKTPEKFRVLRSLYSSDVFRTSPSVQSFSSSFPETIETPAAASETPETPGPFRVLQSSTSSESTVLETPATPSDFNLSSTTSEPNWILPTFPSASVTSPSVRTAAASTQRLSSSSSSSSSEITQQTRTSPEPKSLQLYLVLSLIVKIILFLSPLVNFCRKWRVMTSKDHAVETEYDDVAQINADREEIRGNDMEEII